MLGNCQRRNIRCSFEELEGEYLERRQGEGEGLSWYRRKRGNQKWKRQGLCLDVEIGDKGVRLV